MKEVQYHSGLSDFGFVIPYLPYPNTHATPTTMPNRPVRTKARVRINSVRRDMG